MSMKLRERDENNDDIRKKEQTESKGKLAKEKDMIYDKEKQE